MVIVIPPLRPFISSFRYGVRLWTIHLLLSRIRSVLLSRGSVGRDVGGENTVEGPATVLPLHSPINAARGEDTVGMRDGITVEGADA